MRLLTDEVPVELVGGPCDGQTMMVPWGHGLVRLVDAATHAATHQYLWTVEDDGSHFLRYVGDTVTA